MQLHLILHYSSKTTQMFSFCTRQIDFKLVNHFNFLFLSVQSCLRLLAFGPCNTSYVEHYTALIGYYILNDCIAAD